MRSGNQAEEEFDPTRDAPFDLGLPGGSGHEMAAGLALAQRDAVDMDLLTRERRWLGQLDGRRGDAAVQEASTTLGAGRVGLAARWLGGGMA